MSKVLVFVLAVGLLSIVGATDLNRDWTHVAVLRSDPQVGLGIVALELDPDSNRLYWLAHAIVPNKTAHSIEIRGPVTDPSDSLQVGPVLKSQILSTIPAKGTISLTKDEVQSLQNGKYYVQLNSKDVNEVMSFIRGTLVANIASAPKRTFVTVLENTAASPVVGLEHAMGMAVLSTDSNGAYESFLIHNTSRNGVANGFNRNGAVFSMDQQMLGAFVKSGSLSSENLRLLYEEKMSMQFVTGNTPATTISGSLEELDTVEKSSNGSSQTVETLSAFLIFFTIPFLFTS